jgi:hypothetical protein
MLLKPKGDEFNKKVSGLTPYWCTPTKLCCRPVDHRFEETRWESFAADILVGIVRGNLHQVVRSVWVNLNGVIAASRLIQDLPDRTHIRFDSLRRIKLPEYGQQRGVQSLQGRQRVVDIKAPHVSPEGIVTALRPPNIYARVIDQFRIALKRFMSRAGLEPATHWLKASCSTD